MSCFLVIFFSVFSVTFAQSVFDSIIICGVSCSDGSTWLGCYEAFGNAQSGGGDCSTPGLGVSTCPNNLQTLSIFNFASAPGETYGTSVKFRSISECNSYLKKMQQNTNIPTYTSKKYQSLNVKRSSKNREYELLDKYMSFDNYSESELEELHLLLLPNDLKKRELFESNWKPTLRAFHSYYRKIREATDKPGVFTNSKCAGCSVMVQSIIDSGIDELCGTMQDAMVDALCNRIAGTFNSFCSALVSGSNLAAMVDSICTAALSFTTKGIADSAVKICSELTCTSPQSNSVTNENQITGTCSALSSETINKRCNEFLDAVQLAKKGICIAKGTIEVFDKASEALTPEGTLSALGNLCTGKLPDIFEAATDLAGCITGSSSSKAAIIVGIIVGIVVLTIVIILTYCCCCKKSDTSSAE
jgi:hypothetical protein